MYKTNFSKLSKINTFNEYFTNLKSIQLYNYTRQLKMNFWGDTKLEEQIIIESFALIREATIRVLGIELFDVQLIGGLLLHAGRIVEMKTGEGKTLVALLSAFLNAICGYGVHVVTVNDYLAKRDSEYVGRVHRFLGLTVGVIQQNMNFIERKTNYSRDIVYLSNTELGFDYLRDNIASKLTKR